MRGVGRIRRLIGSLRCKAAILLYHRVTQLQRDPQLLSVSPDHFAQHLAVLREKYDVVSLSTLVGEGLRSSYSRPRVAITFDDGYADNLYEAKPRLERAQCPATVFVTTDRIADDREFWWDELERILLVAPSLPEQLELTVEGETRRWSLSGSDGAAEQHADWHIERGEAPSLRHVVYMELMPMLRRQSPAERNRVLDDLVAWAGLSPLGRESHRSMTGAEVRELAAGGLVEIGAHSRTHSSLPTLSEELQRKEIVDSRQILESLLGNQVRSFAYPFGTSADYDPMTVRLVKEAGFDYACANFPRSVTPSADLFRLPRFLVRDWDGDEFSRNLKSWFAA